MVKYIEPSFEILTELDGRKVLQLIERAGRTCYKSEGKITPESWLEFVKMIIKRQHFSVIEHFSVTVKFICDRGVTHELVRHRIASYSQESTRYCNYAADKFGNEITVIDKQKYIPGIADYGCWQYVMKTCEDSYNWLINHGISPQIARGVLPNDLKTEIVMTANLREWGHVFKLRTSEAAHPCMRDIMLPLLAKFREIMPILFDDLRVFD